MSISDLQEGITFTESQATLSQTYQLGLAARLMGQNESYRRYPIACLQLWIEPAVFLRQIMFFFDAAGRPIGYMTWAFLADDVAKRLVNNPNFLMHISEWNEGLELWILDFVALGGFTRQIINYAMRNMFPTYSVAKFVRRNQSGNIYKVATWRRNRQIVAGPARVDI